MAVKKELPISWVNKFGDRITISDTFEYELTAYKHTIETYHNGRVLTTQGRAELLSSKFVTFDKEVPTQVKVEYYPNKRKPQYIITKMLEMVGAPASYVRNLPVFEYKWIKKTKKKK